MEEMRKNSTKYIIIIIFLIVIALGFKVIQENNKLRATIGFNYQYLVSHAKFLLEQSNAEFWIRELQNENNEKMFTTYIANIEYTARELDRNGLLTVAHQLRLLANNYIKLHYSIKNNGDTVTLEESIIRDREFLTNQIKGITDELGDSKYKWFKEINNSSSKLHSRLNKKFNELHFTGS